VRLSGELVMTEATDDLSPRFMALRVYRLNRSGSPCHGYSSRTECAIVLNLSQAS